MVPGVGLEPTHPRRDRGFKPPASTDSATRARRNDSPGAEDGGKPRCPRLKHCAAPRPHRRRPETIRPNHRPPATAPPEPDLPSPPPAHWQPPHPRSCRRPPPTTGALSTGQRPWAHPHGTGACDAHPPTLAATETRAPRGSADEPLARGNGPRQQIEDSLLPPIATLPVGCDSPLAVGDIPASSRLSRRCATLWGWKQSRSSTRRSRRCWPSSRAQGAAAPFRRHVATRAPTGLGGRPRTDAADARPSRGREAGRLDVRLQIRPRPGAGL